LNLLHAPRQPIEYFYALRLRGDSGPVADHHVQPIEPLAVRLTLAGPPP
jgi:hypothetical protein